MDNTRAHYLMHALLNMNAMPLARPLDLDLHYDNRETHQDLEALRHPTDYEDEIPLHSRYSVSPAGLLPIAFSNSVKITEEPYKGLLWYVVEDPKGKWHAIRYESHSTSGETDCGSLMLSCWLGIDPYSAARIEIPFHYRDENDREIDDITPLMVCDRIKEIMAKATAPYD